MVPDRRVENTMKHNLFSRSGRKATSVVTGSIAAVLLLASGLLAGCSDDAQTKLTETEKANFKGGEMPADYKDPHMPGNNPPAANTGANPPAAVPPAAAPPATTPK